MIEGSLSDVSLPGLLQFLATESNKSFKVSLVSAGQKGDLLVCDGEILSAVFGLLEGNDALTELLFWPEGSFTVVLLNADEKAAIKGNLKIPLQQVNTFAHQMFFLREATVGLNTEIVPSLSFGTQAWQEALAKQPLFKEDYAVLGWITDGRTMRQAMREFNFDVVRATSALFRLLSTGSVEVIRPTMVVDDSPGEVPMSGLAALLDNMLTGDGQTFDASPNAGGDGDDAAQAATEKTAREKSNNQAGKPDAKADRQAGADTRSAEKEEAKSAGKGEGKSSGRAEADSNAREPSKAETRAEPAAEKAGQGAQKTEPSAEKTDHGVGKAGRTGEKAEQSADKAVGSAGNLDGSDLGADLKAAAKSPAKAEAKSESASQPDIEFNPDGKPGSRGNDTAKSLVDLVKSKSGISQPLKPSSAGTGHSEEDLEETLPPVADTGGGARAGAQSSESGGAAQSGQGGGVAQSGQGGGAAQSGQGGGAAQSGQGGGAAQSNQAVSAKESGRGESRFVHAEPAPVSSSRLVKDGDFGKQSEVGTTTGATFNAVGGTMELAGSGQALEPDKSLEVITCDSLPAVGSNEFNEIMAKAQKASEQPPDPDAAPSQAVTAQIHLPTSFRTSQEIIPLVSKPVNPESIPIATAAAMARQTIDMDLSKPATNMQKTAPLGNTAPPSAPSIPVKAPLADSASAWAAAVRVDVSPPPAPPPPSPPAPQAAPAPPTEETPEKRLFDIVRTDPLPIVAIDIERLFQTSFRVAPFGHISLSNDVLDSDIKSILVEFKNGKTFICVATESSILPAQVLHYVKYCLERGYIDPPDAVSGLTADLLLGRVELEQYLLQRRRITGDELRDCVDVARQKSIKLTDLLVKLGFMTASDWDRLCQEKERFARR